MVGENKDEEGVGYRDLEEEERFEGYEFLGRPLVGRAIEELEKAVEAKTRKKRRGKDEIKMYEILGCLFLEGAAEEVKEELRKGKDSYEKKMPASYAREMKRISKKLRDGARQIRDIGIEKTLVSRRSYLEKALEGVDLSGKALGRIYDFCLNTRRGGEGDRERKVGERMMELKEEMLEKENDLDDFVYKKRIKGLEEELGREGMVRKDLEFARKFEEEGRRLTNYLLG